MEIPNSNRLRNTTLPSQTTNRIFTTGRRKNLGQPKDPVQASQVPFL